MELQILHNLFDKSVFDEYNDCITEKQFINGRVSAPYKILTELRAYYNQYDDPISPDALRTIHEVKMGGYSEKERERILQAYEDVKEEHMSDNVKALFREFKLSNIRADIQEALDEGKDDKAMELMASLKEAETEEEELFTTMDIVEIINENSGEGLEAFLPPLRTYLPRLTFGTGQLILARSNAGKSSFLCPQGIHVARGGGKVLHLALSEDGQEELVIRYIQAAYKCTEEYIRANLEKARDKFFKDFGDSLRIFNSTTCSPAEIEKRIEAFKPSLVIYDQYQKVTVGGAHKLSTPEQRTKAASVIKDLAIKHRHHYICATQADKDSGWIVTDLNVDQAKTGAVGEFKVIIGLGKEQDDRLRTINIDGKNKQAFMRNINIAKNKGKMGMFTAYLAPETCEWLVL